MYFYYLVYFVMETLLRATKRHLSESRLSCIFFVDKFFKRQLKVGHFSS